MILFFFFFCGRVLGDQYAKLAVNGIRERCEYGIMLFDVRVLSLLLLQYCLGRGGFECESLVYFFLFLVGRPLIQGWDSILHFLFCGERMRLTN